MGDFGGLSGVLGGTGNIRKQAKKHNIFSGFGGPFVGGAEDANTPPTTREMVNVGVLPSRVLLL